MRTVAFLAGFFFAILAMISPPFKKLVGNSIQVYRQTRQNPEGLLGFFCLVRQKSPREWEKFSSLSPQPLDDSDFSNEKR